MPKQVDANFFKVPKQLLRDDNFKKLTPAMRLMVIYLLSLRNTFHGGWFYQKISKFKEETGLSRTTIWRSRYDLDYCGIQIKVENNRWNFNLDNFYAKFIEVKEDVSN